MRLAELHGLNINSKLQFASEMKCEGRVYHHDQT